MKIVKWYHSSWITTHSLRFGSHKSLKMLLITFADLTVVCECMLSMARFRLFYILRHLLNETIMSTAGTPNANG